MNLVLIFLINASVFSIGGLGEDLSVFKTPFLGNLNKAQIEFTLEPEFNILNEDKNFRGLFWTNPFSFGLRVPLSKGLIFSLGNLERFNQSFDLYLEEDPLDMHLIGEGGVEEIYARINSNLYNFIEIFFQGSYLFGSAREIWDYNIGNYFVTDTFLYKYQGSILCAGIKLFLFSLFYEGLGNLNMMKEDSDTNLNLPELLSIGLNPELADYKFGLLFEHSFWENNASPNRFKISVLKSRFGFVYLFNPWYLGGIKEHGITISTFLPIKNLGFCTFNLKSSITTKESIREFSIIPEVKLTIEEIFARRKK